jgi:hypothetical protein
LMVPQGTFIFAIDNLGINTSSLLTAFLFRPLRGR